ncbi:hypothetical protein HZ326_25260 [Fusarium oxysporum f. sp. albedinis]|nr:hypothetical protein HZ326_25260 [Fusarium oxysporum f. sp. albedinis]
MMLSEQSTYYVKARDTSIVAQTRLACTRNFCILSLFCSKCSILVGASKSAWESSPLAIRPPLNESAGDHHSSFLARYDLPEVKLFP